MRKRISKLLGRYRVESVRIIPYRSYGSGKELYIKGRVLDNRPLEYHAGQSWWQSMRNALRQFDTHEIRDLKVTLTIGDHRLETVTDSKGYFLFDLLLPNDISHFTDHEGWVPFSLFADPTASTSESAVFSGEFLIPDAEADFGIISDIDDTILNTGVTSFLKWKVIRNSLFVNAFRRIPLKDAPQLYRKLHKGVLNKEKNPVFYLSNSPWNMYRYLELFLDHNGFPKGPILLRSFGSIFKRATASEKPHKQKEIINLLENYPAMKFVLIGDSGEHDASIYTDIAVQFPNRIICIYLRSVPHKRRMRHVQSIVDNFRQVPVLMVGESSEAEKHAALTGLI